MDALSEPIVETSQQQFCSEVLKRLNIQRKSGDFCDVTLQIGGEAEMDVAVEMKAHKVVLSSASPFFYNALKSDMQERREGVIRLVEKRKCVMELVLEYLYTGNVDITQANVYDLIEESDYLMLSSLKTLSETFLRNNLTISNCIPVYYCAMKYQCRQLQNEASDYILANFVSVCQLCEDFLDLSSEQVEEWISNDRVIVNGEEDIFGVILHWIGREEESRSKHFCDLFRHVRCMFVSRDYLFWVIAEHRFVQGNRVCLKLVLDALKLIAGETGECLFEQTPRDCLKTHEEAILACGRDCPTLCYLPSEERWYQLKRMHTARIGHATTFCDGKLYVVGGANDGNVAERYDPSFNTWAAIQAPYQVTKHIAVATFHGRVYAVGGKNGQESRSSIVQRYNPEANQWQEVASLSSPRSSVCGVATDDHLYAIGGLSNSRAALHTAERFDLETNSWSRIAPLLQPRNGACGVSYKGKLFLFGGTRFTRTYDMYDIATNQWSSIACESAPRFFGNVRSLTTLKVKMKLWKCHCKSLTWKGKNGNSIEMEGWPTCLTKSAVQESQEAF